jgi:GT2 family glycosyltransferase
MSANRMSANRMSANRMSANRMSANRMLTNKTLINKISINRILTNKILINKININQKIENINYDNNVSNISINKKIGIVITTHGFNGIFIRQCIKCFLRELPANKYIVLYINESADPITLNLCKEFPEINIIYINDQKKNGGLTGTWNQGIDLCINNQCEIIILSNDDLFFDKSILNIIKTADNSKNILEYYGPVSNNPGLGLEKIYQSYKYTINKNNFVIKHNNNNIGLNGFFMVFNKETLILNKFDDIHYFNPKYPFGNNEVDWFKRFKQKGGKGIVVPSTFIYHYKLKSWRKDTILQNVCIYTINTGNYEGTKLYLNNINNKYNCDVLYFTDNIKMFYKCIEHNLIPIYIDTIIKNPKITQRIIKACPHKYLPHNYDISIYIDGNCNLLLDKNQLFNKFDIRKYDMICFKHPIRNNIFNEAQSIIQQKLENSENINKILEIEKNNRFNNKSYGLTETNCLIRKHKKLINFNNELEECIKICVRDQVSFDYLLWKYKINYKRYEYKDKPIKKWNHINPKNRTIK